MKKSLCICLAVALVVAIFSTWSSSLVASPPKEEKLTKITKERVPMNPRLLFLCVGPGAVVGPHAVAEVDIFVNEIVVQYRKENRDQYAYPVGSKFVKWKYPDAGVKDPDIATVMIRTASKGDVSDWEFSMHSLPDEKPLESKARVSCAECHERYEDRGYISDVSEKALREFLQ